MGKTKDPMLLKIRAEGDKAIVNYFKRLKEIRKEKSLFNKAIRKPCNKLLSFADKELMLFSQNYLCAACGKDLNTIEAERICIDHDHITGKVRGILCSNCNVALGQAHDNIGILYKLIAYLNKHSQS
jgi:DNA-directed RNA polymerase subunit RPC12/RpoP